MRHNFYSPQRALGPGQKSTPVHTPLVKTESTSPAWSHLLLQWFYHLHISRDILVPIICIFKCVFSHFVLPFFCSPHIYFIDLIYTFASAVCNVWLSSCYKSNNLTMLPQSGAFMVGLVVSQQLKRHILQTADVKLQIFLFMVTCISLLIGSVHNIEKKS